MVDLLLELSGSLGPRTFGYKRGDNTKVNKKRVNLTRQNVGTVRVNTNLTVQEACLRLTYGFDMK